ncbi:MAG: hypothetical protein LBC87_07210 [Fibromonadaceae bacterium]|jgi:hypothetical protein|nr:hypothetical protein [Fibromonadaceae bacterium]
MLKKGNQRFWLTLPEKLFADMNAMGYITQKDISHFILMAVSEKLERGQNSNVTLSAEYPLD